MKKTAAQQHLKRIAHDLRKKLTYAKLLSQQFQHDWNSWYSLSDDDQALWWKYQNGILQQEVDEANDLYGHSLLTRNPGGGAYVGKLMQEMYSSQQDSSQALSF